MAKKNAKGSGTIRKKTVTRNGKQYTYWEARITTGRDPGTGKQIQRSFTGKTQKEVRQKMQEAAVAVDAGTYTNPVKMTVGAWLDIWADEYLNGLKPVSAFTYRNVIRLHIKPKLGETRLSELQPHMVQQFINGIDRSAETVRDIYMVFHQALNKAVKLGYITKNPSDNCELPRRQRKEIHPLDDHEVAALLEAAKGKSLEHMITVALFTGLRKSEVAGLTWDRIDFENGAITVDRQLAHDRYWKTLGLFAPPKNNKPRVITAAPTVMKALRAQKRKQAEMQMQAGPLWSNPEDFVFTLLAGQPIRQTRITHEFNIIRAAAGLDSVRFHDCRHTFAVNAIRAGDDIKTVQGNLGHATAAFTLDRYGHFTERMKQDSAQRMEDFIKGVLNL